MSGIEQFYTRDAANEGKRLPLRTPAGKLTEHWLQVGSRLSDAFRAAKAVALQAVSAASDDKRAQVAEEARLGSLASLVVAWSFDTPLTPEAVRDFLRNAPQVAEQINSFAGDDEVFFGEGSASSTTTAEPSES